MFPRLTGTEWETCSIVCNEAGVQIASDYFNKDTGAQRIFLENIPSPPALRNLKVAAGRMALSNGGLILLDTGGHWEYASPEGVEAREAMLHHKYGEKLLRETVQNANRALSERKVRIRLFKGNLDVAGNTYGFHESYLIRRNDYTALLLQEGVAGSGGRPALARTMVPFLMSRNLYGGAGWVGRENGKFVYHLSQRVIKTETVVSQGTTSARGILNTRDEPHAPIEAWRRLHVICGDALTFEPALFLTLSATSRVLAMIEEGQCYDSNLPDISGMYDNGVVGIMHQLNRDPTLHLALPIGDKTFTLIDIQEIYRDKARKFWETSKDSYYSGVALPVREALFRDVELGFKLWDWVLENAKKPRPHEALASRIEWAGRLLALEAYGEARGFNLDMSPDYSLPLRPRKKTSGDKKTENLFRVVKDFDLEFQESIPDGIIGRLEREGIVERMVTDEEIQQFADPPPGCRSFFRSRFLRALDALAAELGQAIDIKGYYWPNIIVEVPNASKLPAFIPLRIELNM